MLQTWPRSSDFRIGRTLRYRWTQQRGKVTPSAPGASAR
ncbi:MAG: hypothetical protein RLZZ238_1398, partial [Planctomycetota bacterium]